MSDEEKQKLILTLLDMGFSYSDAENTLHSMNWDIEKAINHLSSSSIISSSSSSSSKNKNSVRDNEIAKGVPISNDVSGNRIAEGNILLIILIIILILILMKVYPFRPMDILI